MLNEAQPTLPFDNSCVWSLGAVEPAQSGTQYTASPPRLSSWFRLCESMIIDVRIQQVHEASE